jgi:HTH-type transcriptional regulator/antitoxin HigA
MDVKPIRTEDDYKVVMRLLSSYFDNEPEPGTEDGDRFEVLLTLVQAYEVRRFDVLPPDPIEAIKFRMEQQGLTVSDMRPYIGPPNRVYEVLSRKRGLSLSMIKRLHAGLGIPADALIG